MDIVESRVDDLAHDGCGIARVDNRVYFVDGVLPGETIRFVPGRKRRGRLSGSLTEIITPSSHRVVPECEYFGVCGGCATQHIHPRIQLQYKEKVLFDNLEKIGGVSPDNRIDAIQGEIWGYRRKARLGVKLVPKKGGILVGFRERRSSFVTSLQHCGTLDPRLSRLLPGLHSLISELCNNHRIPQIEVAAGDDDVAIVIRHLEPLSRSDQDRMIAYAQSSKIQIFSQSGGLDTILPLWPEQPQPLHYLLPNFGLKLEFGPTDFVQVNAEANELMLSQGLKLLELESSDRVLDLFCGIGNFSLALAGSCAKLLGIEGEESLVMKARHNAVLNGIGNADFGKFNLYSEAVGHIPGCKGFNKVLLDPPRSGAYEVVTHLIPALAPELVVYVSCNSATLARDAAVLVNDNGYKLSHAGAIDMFPQTAHGESMAVFRKT
jgi:23S rRNA (uracil1939-C5)-methyltransferase